jgi:cell filamentation protein
VADQDPYVYPGTAVLRNHFDLRDASELQRRENGASSLRVAQLYRAPLEGRYDLNHLKAFHGFIFGDVYPWAADLRSVAIAKGDLFALPQHIEPYLGSVLAQLPAEDFLRDADQDRVVDRLTHYLAEINSVHPFREGNGRTQRAFIAQLADQAGYVIDWSGLDPQLNIAVSQAAHRGDNAPLRTVLADLTVPQGSSRGQKIRERQTAAFPRPVNSALGKSDPTQAQPGRPKPGQQRGRGRPY